MSDLVGATEDLGSRQHVQVLIRLVVMREQDGYGRISDIALVDDGCARHVRSGHHIARAQLWCPATGVGRQCVAAQHHGPQTGIVEQGFHFRVHLSDGITLAGDFVVYGGRGQIDDTGRLSDEFRNQVVGRGGIEQWPDEKDSVDAHERLADNSGVCEVADHRLDSGARTSLTAHEASHARAVSLETADDLTAEVAGRAGDQDR